MSALRTEGEIIESWSEGTYVPLVSIAMITFNHEAFLAKSIEGVLAQETKFSIELIIGEDSSTDKSLDIAMHFQSRYPKIIKIIANTDNVGMNQNFYNVLNFVKGEYVALCEGDDYWTSKDKLETQVRKLALHPDAACCFHDADDLDETSGELIAGRWTPPFVTEKYSIDDLFKYGNFIPTASIVFRREYLPDLSELLTDVPHADFAVVAKLMKSGPILFIDKSMSVYRRHAGGIHSTTWGPISTFRALKTLVYSGDRLGLQHIDSYKVGLRRLFTDLEERILLDQQKIEKLKAELSHLQFTYERARQSRFFRLGIAVDKALRRMGFDPRP